MSAISTILAKLRSAIWAIDVRDDIADAIEQCYSDVSNPTLQTEALEAAIQKKIDEGEMAALAIGDGTITAAKLAANAVTTPKIADGSITQAKLDPNIDFVQVDDTLSQTGEAADAAAVGAAISELNGSLDKYKNFEIVKDVVTLSGVTYAVNGNLFTEDDVTYGYYIDISTGIPVEKTYEVMTDFICCADDATFKLGRHTRICFYDKDKIFISGYEGSGNTDSTEVEAPEGADFFRVTSKGNGTISTINDLVNGNNQKKIFTNMYVSHWDYVFENIGVKWADVVEKDNEVKALKTAEELGYAFDVHNVILEPNVVYPFHVGYYSKIPFALDATPTYGVWFYNANMQVIHSDQHVTSNEYESFQPRNVIAFSDNQYAIVESYTSMDDLDFRLPRTKTPYVFSEDIAYIKFSQYVALNRIYKTTPEILRRYSVSINSEHAEGLMEQAVSSVANDLITHFPSGSDELSRRLKAEMIWQTNAMRHGIRLCTFNSGKAGKANWYKIKEVMQELGVDIAAFQEIAYPLALNEGEDESWYFKNYMKSWQFAHVSENGTIYPKNERMLCTREQYPIDSTEETYLGLYTDYRYVAKSVVSLPRYMDKKGSQNLKMSIYNFQFEVSGHYDIENAQQVLEMVEQDENPFIVICGDTNDFTNDKDGWKVFEDAGYTALIGKGSSTTSNDGGFEVIDQFFVNHRIKGLGYDIIHSGKHQFVSNGTYRDLSDHDIVIADVALDYSDIHTITWTLTNVTIVISNGRTWLSDDETVTITITPDEGYNLAWTSNNFVLRDAGAKIKNDVFVGDNTGGVITLVGSQLRGDFHIQSKGIANT